MGIYGDIWRYMEIYGDINSPFLNDSLASTSRNFPVPCLTTGGYIYLFNAYKA